MRYCRTEGVQNKLTHSCKDFFCEAVLWYHTSFRCAKFRYAISLFFSWAIRSASTAENRFSNDSPREKLIRSTSLVSLSLCGCRGRRKRPISATLDAYSKDRAFDSIPCRRRHCRMWSARACFCRPAVLLFAAIFPDNDSSLFAAKHLPLLSAFKKLFFDSTTDDLNAPCMRYRNLQSKSAPESTGVV